MIGLSQLVEYNKRKVHICQGLEEELIARMSNRSKEVKVKELEMLGQLEYARKVTRLVGHAAEAYQKSFNRY